MSIASLCLGDISDSTHALVAEALHWWYPEGYEFCILKLEAILRNSANLSEADVQYVTFHLQTRQRALEPEYVPPQHYPPEDVFPLTLKAAILREQGDYRGYIAQAWAHLQYRAVGTGSFLYATLDLAEAAVLAKEPELLRNVLRLFLAGWHLQHYTPGKSSLEQEEPFIGSIPLDAALTGIAWEPDPVYAQVLEIALGALMEEDDWKKRVKAALDKYYKDSG